MTETPKLTPQEVMDGVYLLAGDPDRLSRFTLSTIGRNEMFFLPVFLEHYRALGVDRFVILDDNSDDGSRDYLSAQPDVLLLASHHRFGEKVDVPQDDDTKWSRDFRACSIWRKVLLDRYGTGCWSLHMDLDEFIHLPPGLTFPELAESLDPSAGEVVWAAMIETYPSTLQDMAESRNDQQLDLSKEWYFDARQVMVLNGQAAPLRAYKGMMARILTRYGIRKPKGLKPWLRWLLKEQPPSFNTLQKPTLLHWREGDVFLSSHTTSKPAQPGKLLPMMHYKFTGSLYEKMAYALESGAYFRGSRKYHMLEELLLRMSKSKGRFRGRFSKRFTGWDDIKASGNAIGLTDIKRDEGA